MKIFIHVKQNCKPAIEDGFSVGGTVEFKLIGKPGSRHLLSGDMQGDMEGQSIIGRGNCMIVPLAPGAVEKKS
jgi:hypothetical protein